MTATSEAEKIEAPEGGKPDWAMNKAEFERAWRERNGLPRKRRKWPWILLALMVIAAAGFGYYRTQMAPQGAVAPAPTPEPEQVVMQLSPVEVAKLEPQTLKRTVRLIGTLAPIRKTALSAQVGGRVDSVAVQAGDSVTKGQVLMQIDIDTLKLELDQARNNADATKAQLKLAEGKLKRTQSLVDRGVTSSSNLEEAQSSAAALRATLSAQQDQVASAKVRLENATVRAPFDGRISARSTDPGQYVSVGTPLLTIVDLSKVEMQGNAPVGEAATLALGQAVRVTVDGIRDRTFEGKVTRINPVAAEQTRTIPVYTVIDNEKGTLLGGMFATGEVTVNEAKGALAVPTAALREGKDGPEILVVKNGHLKAVHVETGGEWAGGLTHITEGLKAGETVVTAPLPSLESGDAVEIDKE